MAYMNLDDDPNMAAQMTAASLRTQAEQVEKKNLSLEKRVSELERLVKQLYRKLTPKKKK